MKKRLIKAVLCIVLCCSMLSIAMAATPGGTINQQYDSWNLHYYSSAPTSANATSKTMKVDYFSGGYRIQCDTFSAGSSTSATVRVRPYYVNHFSIFYVNRTGNSDVFYWAGNHSDIKITVDAMNYGSAFSASGYVKQNGL